MHHHQFENRTNPANMQFSIITLLTLLLAIHLSESSLFRKSHSRRTQTRTSDQQAGGLVLPPPGNHARGQQSNSNSGGTTRRLVPSAFQGNSPADFSGSVDFTGCETDPDTGLCCVTEEETLQSLERAPILECTHKNIEKCHYTYVTTFSAAQEEICQENFEKSCQITFKQQAMNETVKKCYKPVEKKCSGDGPEECRTVFESACNTRYVEKQPGKFVGDTKCEKLPIEICGAGCTVEEGPEECHDKVIASLIDVPEEVCDLNPQKTCRFQTKLVPKLEPKHECTVIPQEVCNLVFGQPDQVDKPLMTKWCLDPESVPSQETYDQSGSTVITTTIKDIKTPGTGYSAGDNGL